MAFFPKSGVLMQLFHLTLCFFGARWSTRFVRVQFLLVGVWLCWYAAFWQWAFQTTTYLGECTMDCMIAIGLFLFMSLTHIIIVFDTFLHRRRDRQMLREVKDQLTPEIQRRVNLYIAGVFLFIISVRCIIVWTWVRVGNVLYLPHFWISMPSSMGLQLRLMAFLCDILIANERVSDLRQSVKLLARQRQPEAKDVVQLKQQYSHLYKQFMFLSVKYGGSLLLIFMELFIEFVFNAYLMLISVLSLSKNVQTILHHFSFMSYMGLLLMLTCWHCQQSYNLSRQIGCLIPKLVKPFGSKRYNDLVSEFLLQTLHQRFVVTAKDFFNLNLHLLSSMFAAVVTYLVILIQFMFAEKGSQVSRLEEYEF